MKQDKAYAKRTDGASVTGKDTAAKGSGGKRWTAVDTLIVLMVVLAVAGAVVRGVLDVGKTSDAASTEILFVDFTIAEIHPTVLAEIEAFDALYLRETGELLGYVGVYDDGTLALHVVNPLSAVNGSAVTAEGTFVCLDGTYQNGSLLITGMTDYLSPGSVLTLCTERAVLTVEITGIRRDK